MQQRLHEQGPSLHFIFCSPYYIIHLYYHPQSDGVVMFDQITEKINIILPDHPSTRIYISGDFNIQSTQTKPMKKVDTTMSLSRSWMSLSVLLIQQVKSFQPLSHPLSIVTYLELFRPLIGLGQDWCKPKASSAVPFHRTIFQYSKANWETFSYFSLLKFLSHHSLKMEHLGQPPSFLSGSIWKITNKVLNRSKSPMISIINRHEIISSGKVKLLTMNSVSDYTVDDQGHLTHMANKHCYHKILTREVLDSLKLLNL